MTPRRRLNRAKVRPAALESSVLAVACLIAYLIVTHVLSHVHFLSRADDLLGGMWATIATVFVLRDSYQRSMVAAVSRMAATSVSFVFCLLYLFFLPSTH